ncbi:MAG: radical SAM protein [Proteobacteria bacterium]|nr:radical SAM protein [Pseudomonadota bacterium]
MTETGGPELTVDWVGVDGQPMRRLELHLTYVCGGRCVFCSEAHRMVRYRQFPMTWGQVATVLRKHARRGVTNLHLTGGEPTLHPHFVDTIRLAKKLGMKTSLGTLGGRLSHEAFAREAAPWLDEGLFSLHGPTAEVHNRAAGRKKSFARVIGAMELMPRLNRSFDVFVNTVVTRWNVDELGQTVALADSLGAKLIVVSNLAPEGRGEDRYAELAVPFAKLSRVLPLAAQEAKRAVVRFFGVPMCVLGDARHLSNDLFWDPRVTVEWATMPQKVVLQDQYNWHPFRRRLWVDECAECELKGVCAGVFDKYAELWSTKDLKPEFR